MVTQQNVEEKLLTGKATTFLFIAKLTYGIKCFKVLLKQRSY